MSQTDSVLGGPSMGPAIKAPAAKAFASQLKSNRLSAAGLPLKPVVKAMRTYHGHVMGAILFGVWMNLAVADVVGPMPRIPATPVGECAPDITGPMQACAEITEGILTEYRTCLWRASLGIPVKCAIWPTPPSLADRLNDDGSTSVACRYDRNVNGPDIIDFWPTCQPSNSVQPEKNLGGCSAGKTMKGNPINVATGNKYQREDDFAMSGSLLRVVRHYNSQAVRGGRYGTNWTDTYQRSIYYESNGQSGAARKESVTMRRPDGRIVRFFRLSSAGAWVSDSGDVGTLVTTKVTVEGNPENLPMYAVSSRDLGYVGARLTVNGDPDGWTYVNENNELETYSGYSALYADTYFDGAHRLEKIEGAAGGSLNISYSEGRRYSNGGHWGWGNSYQQVVDSVVDENGRQLRFSYDQNDRVVAVLTPMQVIGYEYSDSSDLSSEVGLGRTALARVTYPDGATRQYRYAETPHTRWSSESLPYGGSLQVSEVPMYTQDPEPETGSLGSFMVLAQYNNSLTGLIDENGNRYVSWGHDTSGRAISSEHGVNGVDKYVINYAGGYGAAVVTDPLGSKRGYTFATFGGVAKQTSSSQPGGSGCDPSNSTTDYDTNGNVTSAKDFNGNQVCYTNDMARNVALVSVSGISATDSCSTALAAGASLPTGARKTTVQWHPTWRLKAKIAVPMRLITNVYNGQPDPFNGNAIASCAGGGTLSNGWPIATLCKTVEQATTDATGALGFGAALQSGVANRVKTFTYNTKGQMLTATDARGKTTTLSYYPTTGFGHTAGDLQSVTNAAGMTTSYTSYTPYGAWLTATDTNGVVTANTYDLRGRLLSTNQGGETTRWTYDLAGQLLTMTPPDGATISMTYDSAHRLVRVMDAVGNKVDYTLDNAGNRIAERITDASGVLVKTITRTFDALSRVYNVTGASE